MTQTQRETIEPICSHYEQCGGCSAQHLAPRAYSKWKTELALAPLVDVGIDLDPVEVNGPIAAPGRRRVTFKVRESGGGTTTIGFFGPRTHDFVAVRECPVLTPGLQQSLSTLSMWVEQLRPAGLAEADMAVLETENGLDIDVRSTSRNWVASAIAARFKGLARLSHNGETVAQYVKPRVTIDGVVVFPPPTAFFQPTVSGEEQLQQKVREAVSTISKKKDKVVDLFSGCGTFTLPIARDLTVTAFDSDAGMISALKEAAKEVKGRRGLFAEVRDLMRRPLHAQELNQFDVAVLDPPRAGAAKQVAQIAKSRISKVVSVSCYPATFARDARQLVQAGFKLLSLDLVDQFEWSPHIEMVGLFRRP